jgi:hypothetical protein
MQSSEQGRPHAPTREQGLSPAPPSPPLRNPDASRVRPRPAPCAPPRNDRSARRDRGPRVLGRRRGVPLASDDWPTLDEEIAARITAYLFGGDEEGALTGSRRARVSGWRRRRFAARQARSPELLRDGPCVRAEHLRGEVHRICAPAQGAGVEGDLHHRSGGAMQRRMRPRRRSRSRGRASGVSRSNRPGRPGRLVWAILTRVAVLVIFAMVRRGRRRSSHRARGFSV